MSDKTVLLRQKGSKESKPFAADHAERLLAFPRTEWEQVADEVTGDGSSKKLPPADNTKKTAPAAPKKKAVAVKVAPATAAPVLPEVDTTGQPTSI